MLYLSQQVARITKILQHLFYITFFLPYKQKITSNILNYAKLTVADGFFVVIK